MRINYYSYAHVIEKGMNKRNMSGMAKVLFDFMCEHDELVSGRITRIDKENGIFNKPYIVPDKESMEWYKGEHDVAETLKKAAGAPEIIAEAPKYFEEKIIDGLINFQKLEKVINGMCKLIESDDSLDDKLRERWLELKEDEEYASFLAEIFLYAVPQPNCDKTIKLEAEFSDFDDEETEELLKFEEMVKKHAKPETTLPPLKIDSAKEMKYIRQLLKAYADAEGLDYIELEDIKSYKNYQSNFERQRRVFYAADSIREASKEILKLDEKDGFDIVKQEVYDEVVPVWELSMSKGQNGYERLLTVIDRAGNAQLSGNTKMRLLEWVTAAEKQGMCHFLVGEDKLWWVDEDKNI